MEVNIKNAFLIVVKVTWRYYSLCLENVTVSLLNLFEMLIYLLLENPIVATLLLSILTLLLMIALSLSFIILAGVFCIIAIIIICEGMICLSFILFVGIILSCLLIIMANVHGMHIWINNLLKVENMKMSSE